MANWRESRTPFRGFTEEITQEWIEKGFSKEECQGWLEADFGDRDSGYCAWLRDEKNFTPKQNCK